jgi:hypothetical protein
VKPTKIKRAAPSVWDALELPRKVDRKNDADIFSWVDASFPRDLEHDYILFTDGSGCVRSWGGAAGIILSVRDFDGVRRGVADSDVVVAGNFGQTVNRNELSAFLDGLYKILTLELQKGKRDEVGMKQTLRDLKHDRRVTVKWYTDRSSLAKSLLFDDMGEPLAWRGADADLWARFSFYAKHLCITPLRIERNSHPLQELCDALADWARKKLKDDVSNFEQAFNNNQLIIKWNKEQQQTARF